MLLQIGNFKFEGLKLPISWSDNYRTNYFVAPIIGGKPVVQMTGESLVEIELSVLFSDEFCTPENEINGLQLSRRNGEVLQVTGGDGTNYGRFVITEISRVIQRALDSSGYISSISANIKLLEYNTTKKTIANNGTALADNNLVIEEPIVNSDTEAQSLQVDITKGVSDSKSISENTNSASVKFAKISALATSANAAFTSANEKIQDAKVLLRRAKELENSITAAKNALALVKQASEAQSLEDLYAANTLLEASMYNMNGASAPISAFVGSKEWGY